MSTVIDRRFLSLRDAAEYAGLSVGSIKRLIQEQRLNAFRPLGGRTLVDILELERIVIDAISAPCTRGPHRKASEPNRVTVGAGDK